MGDLNKTADLLSQVNKMKQTVNNKITESQQEIAGLTRRLTWYDKLVPDSYLLAMKPDELKKSLTEEEYADFIKTYPHYEGKHKEVEKQAIADEKLKRELSEAETTLQKLDKVDEVVTKEVTSTLKKIKRQNRIDNTKVYDANFEDPDEKPNYKMWAGIAVSAIVLLGILTYILFMN